ncbi:NAD(P)H-dependent oxidoreductase [Listeria marthii]|uniref:NAD(P)H-dependent oxidoreductase n=1 Tax=Listeria marthii TaxID=529731 RepID=UPI00162A7DE6|nr:NAD(P)H-dependent oxidoreductase [Listeria marthii]MBC2121085.1 NAD(P)H-dependent oxidoreductase [Listeria marthii]MBF2394675.1 NAD(P)H-dependent oxidoreductase [Listeria marthii]MBF2515562.1 NAD(P)H-dependent oxidoreductase [Listeria marthii]MBF2518286.1 NAD(P)H-dependent oxidoreductase [Listeria marthii]MBF2588221.1 NAD(P)H-dependent oxidoreductase [Listeria marthii]
MKTLVIIAHPNIENSRVNKVWKEALLKNTADVQIHELYQAYPNWDIDVAFEQQQLQNYDKVIIQFPFYWYSYPPLLKKWFDDVFSHGWAYGSKGDKMADKKLALAISIGDKQYNYQENAPIGYSLETLLTPFRATINHIKADYRGAHTIFGSSFEVTDEEIAENAKVYAREFMNTF